jgi:hypothetical protein
VLTTVRVGLVVTDGASLAWNNDIMAGARPLVREFASLI